MIRVGIIGAGAMGRYVARLLGSASEDIQFISVYDPDPEALEKCLPLPGISRSAVAASVDEVLASNCDWVMIASLNCQHAEQTIAAFEAGKHVFCQKPLAINFQDCLAMKAAWQASGKEFSIGFTLRYSPHYREIKSLIDEGLIGDIISLEFNETLDFNHGGFIHGDWRRHTHLAGSHVLEKCSHDIDIVNWLVASRASRVASFGGANFFTPEHAGVMDEIPRAQEGHTAYRVHRGAKRGIDPFTQDKDIVDNQVVILEYANGVRATFHMNANTVMPERRLYICGTRGTLRADVMTGTIEVQQIGFDTLRLDRSAGVSGLHGGGDQVLVEELLATMQRTGAMSAGIEEGLAAATTCFAIDEALFTGQVVSLASLWHQADATV